MKKLFTLAVLSIFTISIWAQSPNKLSYQAVVRDGDNNLVTEQAVGMQVSILQSSASGTAVYTETHTPTTNANGLVTIEVGGGATADDFSAIDWASGPYFIKTEIDPAGGTSYTITATSQLLSVPYAKYADKAGSVEITGTETVFDSWDKDASDDFSGDYSDLTGKPTKLSSFDNDEGYIAADGGNVEISGDYLYDSPKEQYISYSSHHFTADNPSIPLTRTNTRYVYFASGSGVATASAPVNLPDGAIVTSVTAYLLDNDAGEDSNVYLRWYKHDDTFGTMASCGTSNAETSASQYIKTDNTIEEETIDNSTTTYFLHYYGAASNANIKLQSVKITYTVTQVD